MMDHIGLIFKIPNQWNDVLYRITGNLQYPSVWSRSDHDEILTQDYNGNIEPKSLFPENRKAIDNYQMKKYIQPNMVYYPIFVSFSVYFSKQKFYPTITTMHDFLSSPYHTVISTIDVTDVTVVSKEQAILEKIEAVYNKLEFRNLHYLDRDKNKVLEF